MGDKTEELQEMDDVVEPLRAEVRVLRQQLGKASVPVKPKAAAGNVSAPVAAADNQSQEVEDLKQQLGGKKEECAKYTEEIHKLTLEMSEMNDRAIGETMQHNSATEQLQKELAQMKEEEIPKLQEEATEYHKQYQEEILQVQAELQLQQKTSEDVIESEA